MCHWGAVISPPRLIDEERRGLDSRCPRDTTRSAILSSLSGHFCAFIACRSSEKTRDGRERKRSTKKESLNEACTVPDHRSNYLGNPIYRPPPLLCLPRRVLASLLDSHYVVPRPATLLAVVRYPYNRPSLSFFVPSALDILVSSRLSS